MGNRIFAHGLIGLAIYSSFTGKAWARLWYYHLAWWGFIILADGLVKTRQGNSLLWDRQEAFAALAFASTCFWFFFELINLATLNNWHYEGVARVAWLRWLGAHVAFATVLPGVLVTYELLTAWGLAASLKMRPLPPGNRWYTWFHRSGALMLALPLLWPGLFFPLVWEAVFFLLEPLNHRLGTPSLMRDWQRGDLGNAARLLLAGGLCGLLWESQNLLSSARWVYTLPWLNQPKLFAIPLAGYLGFPPFALECYAAAASLSLLRGGRGWQEGDHQRRPRAPIAPAWRQALLVLGGLCFNLLVLYLMDQRVVKSFGG